MLEKFAVSIHNRNKNLLWKSMVLFPPTFSRIFPFVFNRRNSSLFWTIRGQVNDNRIFIFVWTIPLKYFNVSSNDYCSKYAWRDLFYLLKLLICPLDILVDVCKSWGGEYLVSETVLELAVKQYWRLKLYDAFILIFKNLWTTLYFNFFQFMFKKICSFKNIH